MKVVSLVPSLTETLVEAGVEVVGRTRFCIHPSDRIKSIPVVGGTKNIEWDKIKALTGADILVLDKEENPKSFADESSLPYTAVHVENIASCIDALDQLSKELKNPTLAEYAKRFQKLKPKKIALDHFVNWIQKSDPPPEKIEYLIWRNPIMAVGKNTFIGSTLEYLGHELPLYDKKYPELPDTLRADTTYLFSSEPYPFHKHKDWIQSAASAGALVDGESFSWFGIRSLRFLEKMLS